MFNYSHSWHACCELNGPFSVSVRPIFVDQSGRMPIQVHISVFHFVQTICSDMKIQHDFEMQWMLYRFELTHIIYSFVISANSLIGSLHFTNATVYKYVANNGCRLIVDFWCDFSNALHFYPIINHTFHLDSVNSNNFCFWFCQKIVIMNVHEMPMSCLDDWTISSQISKHIRRLFNVQFPTTNWFLIFVLSPVLLIECETSTHSVLSVYVHGKRCRFQ